MLKSALLVAAGIIVGAGAIQGLHAATGGGYYTVAEINVKDRATYDKDLPAVLSTIKDAGGVYLAGGFDKATLEYGSPSVPPVANRYVIIRYDSKDGYEKAWATGIKKFVGEQEKTGTTFRQVGVEGVEAK